MGARHFSLPKKWNEWLTQINKYHDVHVKNEFDEMHVVYRLYQVDKGIVKVEWQFFFVPPFYIICW